MESIGPAEKPKSDMPYAERVRAYERQKKTASLVCKTPEEYESMVKVLADLWNI